MTTADHNDIEFIRLLHGLLYLNQLGTAHCTEDQGKVLFIARCYSRCSRREEWPCLDSCRLKDGEVVGRECERDRLLFPEVGGPDTWREVFTGADRLLLPLPAAITVPGCVADTTIPLEETPGSTGLVRERPCLAPEL